MARYGCTITVAAGKIPSSQSNFSWVATEDNFPTASIDGGSTSIANGGGNLRCYTDSTKATQIPIEIPAGSFVTGVSPSIVVWGLSPALDVGGTVYIEADTVATSQPAASNTYGSEKVWVAKEAFWHGNALTDVTGNGSDLSIVGSATVNNTVDGFLSYTVGDNDGFKYLLGTQTFTATDTVTTTKWFKRTSDNGSPGTNFYEALIGFTDTGGVDGLESAVGALAALDNKVFAYTNGGNTQGSTTGTATALNTWYKSDIVYNQSANEILFYLNGSLDLTVTGYTDNSAGGDEGFIDIRKSQDKGIIGSSRDQGWQIGAPTADQLSSEYNNQSSPSAFWTTGTWDDQDASITIIESTGTLNLSTQNPTIEFTGTIAVEESTSTLNTTSQSPAITFTATLTIVESTQTISLTGFDPTIALTPPSTLVVVESTQSIDWTTQSPNITLSGTLTIEESTQTIDMLTRRPVIQLGIPTYTQIFTGIEKSYEFTGTIKSYGFTGIIATSQIFSGTEKAATFSGVKH